MQVKPPNLPPFFAIIHAPRNNITAVHLANGGRKNLQHNSIFWEAVLMRNMDAQMFHSKCCLHSHQPLILQSDGFMCMCILQNAKPLGCVEKSIIYGPQNSNQQDISKRFSRSEVHKMINSTRRSVILHAGGGAYMQLT